MVAVHTPVQALGALLQFDGVHYVLELPCREIALQPFRQLGGPSFRWAASASRLPQASLRQRECLRSLRARREAQAFAAPPR